MDAIVSLTRPLIVLQRAPSTLQQDRSQQSWPSFGNPPAPIGVARLVLPGDQPRVRSDLSSVFETVRIVDVVHDRLCRHATDAVDRLHSLDLFICIGDLLKLFFNGLKMAFKALQTGLTPSEVRLATIPRRHTGQAVCCYR